MSIKLVDEMVQEEVDEENMEEHYGWTASQNPTADLRLISSDDYIFWVSSEKLALHSPVFRSMLNSCDESSSEATVRLTDPDFETANELVIALLVMECPSVSDTWATIEYDQGCCLDASVVAFAQKYEMISVIMAIKIHLFSLAAQYPSAGGEYVLVAASLEEWDLCGRLIGSLEYSREFETGEVINMRREMDWRGWTPAMIEELGKIGPKFAWAVCRAGTKCATLEGRGRIDHVAMGQELARLMTYDDEYDSPDDEREDRDEPTWWK